MDELIKKFQDWRAKIVDMESSYKSELSKYQAEMKAEFGIADGEPANAFDLLLTIKKVIEKSK